MINASDLIIYQINRLIGLYNLIQNEFCADAVAQLSNWIEAIKCAEVELDFNFYSSLRRNVWRLKTNAAREGIRLVDIITKESDLLIGIITTTVAALDVKSQLR